jgi:hypothetical protein
MMTATATAITRTVVDLMVDSFDVTVRLKADAMY